MLFFGTRHYQDLFQDFTTILCYYLLFILK